MSTTTVHVCTSALCSGICDTCFEYEAGNTYVYIHIYICYYEDRLYRKTCVYIYIYIYILFVYTYINKCVKVYNIQRLYILTILHICTCVVSCTCRINIHTYVYVFISMLLLPYILNTSSSAYTYNYIACAFRGYSDSIRAIYVKQGCLYSYKFVHVYIYKHLRTQGGGRA